MKLDPDQQRVADWTPAEGNLRVASPAGSGKTSTIVELVSRLTTNGIVDPTRLVVTTFTNRAGAEFTERLKRRIPTTVLAQMRVGTFHALALRLFRVMDPEGSDTERCIDLPAGERAPAVPSSIALWAKVVGRRDIASGLKGLGLSRADAKLYASAAGVLRAEGIDSTYDLPSDRMGLPLHFREAWDLFQTAKSRLHVWEFADLLTGWRNGLVRGVLDDLADVVIVDEAQDESKTQLDIAQQLARDGKIVLVGDASQVLYSFAGAYPDLFLDAERTLNAKTICLRTNYRSLPEIVDVGNKIVRFGQLPGGVEAIPHRTGHGKVEIWPGGANPTEEAEKVAQAIHTRLQMGEAPDRFLVLHRTNAGLLPFAVELDRLSVPFKKVGGDSILDSGEAQDIIAYVRLSLGDNPSALARIANRPVRYIRAGEERTATGLIADVAKLRKVPWKELPGALRRILTPMLDSPDIDPTSDEARADLYTAALVMLTRFPSAAEFLAFVTRQSDSRVQHHRDPLPVGKVALSTCHKVKALERPIVFVCASEGVLPYWRAANPSGKPAALQAEARLFYVACTRARDELILTWEKSPHGQGSPAAKVSGPSRFLRWIELG